MDIKVQNRKMLMCFFDIRSIIYFEFVAEGTAVNRTFLRGGVQDAYRYRGEQARKVVERSLNDSSPQERAGRFFALSVGVFSRKRHLLHGPSAILS
jgi:hypothetical protein